MSYASHDGSRSSDLLRMVLTEFKGFFFAWFMTNRKIKILARATIEIQKENWKNWGKKSKSCHVFLNDTFLSNDCLINSKKCVVNQNFIFGFHYP